MAAKGDMTEGKPLGQILLFTLPMLVGGLFQQFYNVVDTLVVGNAVGSRALAAIGATGSTTFFLLAVSMGLTNAFSIVIAQYFGAKRTDLVRRTFVSTIYITIACAIVFSLVGIVCARPLMRLLEAPADIIDSSVLYIQICVGCCGAQLAYNSAAAVLRAVGDSRTPLYFLIVACLLNIGLDLLFVLGLGYGVGGVGVATVLSQLVSAVLCIAYLLWKYPVFRITGRDFRPDPGNMGLIAKIGLPIGLQTALLSVGDMTVSGVINSFGTDVVAAYATGYRVQQFASLAYFNAAQAFSVFAGQNLGAHKPQRVVDGFRKVAGLVVGTSLLSALLVFFFGDALVLWFIADGDAHVASILPIAREYLRISACFYPFLGLIWLYNNTLRGMGQVPVPMASGFIELAAKVGLSFLLSAWLGYVGIWYANPIGWVLGLIPPVISFHRGKWRQSSLAGQPKTATL